MQVNQSTSPNFKQLRIKKSPELIESIRKEEREKLLNEGYIHKSDCPKARQNHKLKELKKANKSLQRKITELQLQLETIKMMR